MKNVDKLMVDVKTAADLLSLSTKQVYELAAAGHIQKAYVGEGTRNFRIPVKSLDDYVASLPADPVQQAS